MAETTKDANESLCEKLFIETKARGKIILTTGNNWASENREFGHRLDIKEWTWRIDYYGVIATEESYINWGPASDNKHTKQTLDIWRYNNLVFSAKRKGLRLTENFSVGDERFQDSEVEKGKAWYTVQGEIPTVLKDFLKPKEKK